MENSKKCSWCGALFNDTVAFQQHQAVHREIDALDSLLNNTHSGLQPDLHHQDIENYFDDDFLEYLRTITPENAHTGEVAPGPSHSSEIDACVENRYPCRQCSKTYTSKDHLRRHVRSEHEGLRHSCSLCGNQFKNIGDKTRHERGCMGQREHVCPTCDKRCSTAHGLRRHRVVHNRPTTSRGQKKRQAKEPVTSNDTPLKSRTETYRCRRCEESFDNRRDLYLHGMTRHYQTGGGLQAAPWGQNAAPWQSEDGTVDRRLRTTYDANAPLILEEHRPGPVSSTYNYPVDNDLDLAGLVRMAEDVYGRQRHAFKLNLTFGVILQNRDTGEYRYFKPYANSSVFDVPMYLSNQRDLQRLRLRLRQLDVLDDLLRNRPDTKWIPVLLTNVRFSVYHTHYPLGTGSLPAFLKQNHCLVALDSNRQTGTPYDDDLCAFRCLALHRGHDVKSLEGPTRDYFRRWQSRFDTPFQGLAMFQFPDFEEMFEVNLQVYRLDEEHQAWSVYLSKERYADTMYVNLYENHLSYIQNFQSYAKKFRCRTCDKHFNHTGNFHQHQRICTGKTKYVYPGGFFKPTQTIFQKLAECGGVVPEVDRTFPWFVVFDFEAMLVKAQETNSEKLTWTQRHVPISVSVCSNVPEFRQPQCFVDPDINKLVKSMVEYMEKIAKKVTKLSKGKWGWVMDRLKDMAEEEQETDREDDAPADKTIKNLMGNFKGYMTQVPVLGFNSARYDLYLVKQTLARHLNMHDEEHSFVVKKNNEYTCISSPTLKFLDMMQFLAPGTSYAKFLKAYGVEEKKGYFPYEFLDDIRKLDYTELPPHDAFHSSLKNTNITDEEYAYCQRVWNEEGMTEFKDFLVWYNNLDVGPFVKAVERFQQFYFNRGIDVLKTAISIPGIARQMLFKTAREAGVNFALFDKNNVDLHHTFKNNIVGGPSIIFTRRHRAEQTRIRGKKLCRKIIGLDANALYLWAIDQKMPVGEFVRRRADGDFRPEVRDKYAIAYHWMGWLNHTEKTSISRRLNSGVEKRIGKYPVDGWDPNTNTVYQFHGCYFHGHDCHLTQNIKDQKWRNQREKKLKKTKDTTVYLKRRGHQVVEMWECDFRDYCRTHPEVKKYVNSTRPNYFRKHPGPMTQEQLLKGVMEGELFGALEVDIEVPDIWPEHFRHPSMTPHQYFREMCPLFCTTDVPFEAMGNHMQKHAKRVGLSEKPRRLLVGGTKGERLLIATPLLRWYLQHGMKVNCVHQVVEYEGRACFQNFVGEVSEARRAGDAHPDKAVIADTMKVIGNSGYGSLIMDKTKHREIDYVQGENKSCLAINDPRFRKLDKYVDRSDFEYCEMDTDSAYMAISDASLDDVIKPEMRADYHHGLQGFCCDEEIKADSKFHWFPRTCCSDHARYDKRTPGLFKLEYEGEEMIGLCSKTYIVARTRKLTGVNARVAADRLSRRARGLKPRRKAMRLRKITEHKFSSKGINKRMIKNPLTIFRRVLSTAVPASGINKGFRAKNNTIYTYTQQRRGFSYFYCKRRVLADGVHTAPLDVVLRPPLYEPEVNDKQLATMLEELLQENEGKTRVVKVSVASLRKMGFSNLRQWLSDPNHVYIGRRNQHVNGAVQSPWHNPFKVSESSRDEVVTAYERYVRNTPHLYDNLEDLRGKTLGCWCHPEPCHGDVLVKLLEEKDMHNDRMSATGMETD